MDGLQIDRQEGRWITTNTKSPTDFQKKKNKIKNKEAQYIKYNYRK